MSFCRPLKPTQVPAVRSILIKYGRKIPIDYGYIMATFNWYRKTSLLRLAKILNKSGRNWEESQKGDQIVCFHFRNHDTFKSKFIYLNVDWRLLKKYHVFLYDFAFAWSCLFCYCYAWLKIYRGATSSYMSNGSIHIERGIQRRSMKMHYLHVYFWIWFLKNVAIQRKQSVTRILFL